MRPAPRAIVLCITLSVSSAVNAEDPKAYVSRKLAEYDKALIKKDLRWFSANWDRGYSENMGGAPVARRQALDMMKAWFDDVTVSSCQSKLFALTETKPGLEWHVVAQTSFEGKYAPPGKHPAPIRSFLRYQQNWILRGKEWKVLNMWSVSRNTKINGKTIKP